MNIILIIAIILLIAGVIRVFTPNLFWSMTKFSNDISGVKSERTSYWEKTTLFMGYLFLVLGMLSFVFLIWAGSKNTTIDNTTDSIKKEEQLKQEALENILKEAPEYIKGDLLSEPQE